jgi:Glyoxalase-like domain
MLGMRLDHVSYAAGPEGLQATASRIGALLGEDFREGGVHPRFGTRNMVLPLTAGTYVEIVACLEHPASDKAPFGRAVRARSLLGGGWLAWVVSVEDINKIELRLGRDSVQGNRHRPDGVELRWRQVGVVSMQTDPQLPFFVEWQSPPEQHPSAGGTGRVRLDTLEIAGDPQRMSDWLGNCVEGPLEDVAVEWVAPDGAPGIVAARFDTPNGAVRV